MGEEPDSERLESSKWNICEIGEQQKDILKRLEKLEHRDNKTEETAEKEWIKESMDELKQREKEGKL